MPIVHILMGRSDYLKQNAGEQYPNARTFTLGDWTIWYEGEEPSEGEIYKFLAEGEGLGSQVDKVLVGGHIYYVQTDTSPEAQKQKQSTIAYLKDCGHEVKVETIKPISYGRLSDLIDDGFC